VSGRGEWKWEVL
jgi:hypothetical protein